MKFSSALPFSLLSLVTLLSLAAALALPTAAMAQVPLFDGFGGAAGYGAACLGPNDDGSSRRVDLTPIFPAGIRFFDRTHTSMFVNTNGNVSFSEAVPTYTPEAFPVADQPMIAPFWADVDIRTDADDCDGPGGGTGYAGDCESPGSNGVWWHLDTAGRRVIVTWDQVGYYSCHTNKEMNFQLVLTPYDGGMCGNPGDFDVEFRYNTCEWNTGDASGGSDGMAGSGGPTSFPCVIGRCLGDGSSCSGSTCTVDVMPTAAQAGFDAGNETDFVEIPGSRSNTIHTILCTMSNVGEPGIWRYQIRSGAVLCPDANEACDTRLLGACAAGRTRCVAGGTECHPEVTPSAESCDAIDNDCDGTTDEGDDLCGAAEICDRGTCISTCFEGGCSAGQVCDARGQCVDAGCESLTCPPGERCVAGACTGACDGVTCPAGQSCSNGRCVDLCVGNTCDPVCTACDLGTCIARCQDAGCPSGKECADDGLCVDTGCAALECAAGTTCRAGSCVDACVGAVCPTGDTCVGGECVPAGVTPRPDGGTGPGPDGGPGVDGGATTDSGGPTIEDPRDPAGRSGCACDASPGAGDAGSLALVLLGLWVGTRRRWS